jgi:urea transport system substrate-binding protein
MMTHKNKILFGAIFILIIGLLVIALFIQKFTHPPIKVGVLHSLTGSMAVSEKPVVDATLMAIDEINAKGGILGRKIKPIVYDGKSDAHTFAKGAEYLITEEKVSAIFGVWTSDARKTIKPIIESHKSLLMYPVQYEGLEESQNIFYTGATPNQQIVPGVLWAFQNLGTKFFLVGSDYVFPRIANVIIKDQVAQLGGTVVGEEYIPLGGKDVDAIIDKIIQAKPDVILNTINGESNIPFFKQLRAKGIRSAQTPTISFSIAEQELQHMNLQDMIGDYAVWSYFQSINTPINAEFIVNFKKKYSENAVVDDPMEAAYFGVHLWANAVNQAGTDNTKNVIEHLQRQNYPAPEGIIYIDARTNHTWKFVRIGKIRFDGQFSTVWNLNKQIRPVPFLPFKTKEEWKALLDSLYKEWGNKWQR